MTVSPASPALVNGPRSTGTDSLNLPKEATTANRPLYAQWACKVCQVKSGPASGSRLAAQIPRMLRSAGSPGSVEYARAARDLLVDITLADESDEECASARQSTYQSEMEAPKSDNVLELAHEKREGKVVLMSLARAAQAMLSGHERDEVMGRLDKLRGTLDNLDTIGGKLHKACQKEARRKTGKNGGPAASGFLHVHDGKSYSTKKSFKHTSTAVVKEIESIVRLLMAKEGLPTNPASVGRTWEQSLFNMVVAHAMIPAIQSANGGTRETAMGQIDAQKLAQYRDECKNVLSHAKNDPLTVLTAYMDQAFWVYKDSPESRRGQPVANARQPHHPSLRIERHQLPESTMRRLLRSESGGSSKDSVQTDSGGDGDDGLSTSQAGRRGIQTGRGAARPPVWSNAAATPRAGSADEVDNRVSKRSNVSPDPITAPSDNPSSPDAASRGGVSIGQNIPGGPGGQPVGAAPAKPVSDGQSDVQTPPRPTPPPAHTTSVTPPEPGRDQSGNPAVPTSEPNIARPPASLAPAAKAFASVATQTDATPAPAVKTSASIGTQTESNPTLPATPSDAPVFSASSGYTPAQASEAGAPPVVGLLGSQPPSLVIDRSVTSVSHTNIHFTNTGTPVQVGQPGKEARMDGGSPTPFKRGSAASSKSGESIGVPGQPRMDVPQGLAGQRTHASLRSGGYDGKVWPTVAPAPTLITSHRGAQWDMNVSHMRPSHASVVSSEASGAFAQGVRFSDHAGVSVENRDATPVIKPSAMPKATAAVTATAVTASNAAVGANAANPTTAPTTATATTRSAESAAKAWPTVAPTVTLITSERGAQWNMNASHMRPDQFASGADGKGMAAARHKVDAGLRSGELGGRMARQAGAPISSAQASTASKQGRIASVQVSSHAPQVSTVSTSVHLTPTPVKAASAQIGVVSTTVTTATAQVDMAATSVSATSEQAKVASARLDSHQAQAEHTSRAAGTRTVKGASAATERVSGSVQREVSSSSRTDRVTPSIGASDSPDARAAERIRIIKEQRFPSATATPRARQDAFQPVHATAASLRVDGATTGSAQVAASRPTANATTQAREPASPRATDTAPASALAQRGRARSWPTVAPAATLITTHRGAQWDMKVSHMRPANAPPDSDSTGAPKS